MSAPLDPRLYGDPALYGYQARKPQAPTTALSPLFEGFAQAQDDRQFAEYASNYVMAAQERLRALGGPEAETLADMLVSAPGAAMQIAERAGGFENIERGLRNRNQWDEFTTSMGQLPKKERPQDWQQTLQRWDQFGGDPIYGRQRLGADFSLGLTAAEIFKTTAEGYAESATGAPKLTDIDRLRREYLKQSSEFIQRREALESMEALLENPSGISDVGMIFAIMRMYDPDSVVREGEQLVARKTAAIPEELWVAWQKVKGGTAQLGPKQKQDFLNAAKGFYNTSLARQQERVERYSRIAFDRGMNPRNVAVNLTGLTDEQLAEWTGRKGSDAKALSPDEAEDLLGGLP